MSDTKFIDAALITRIEGFLAATRMTPTGFGRKVSNDSTLLADLRDGRELRRKTREKIEAFIAASLPHGKTTARKGKSCSRKRVTQ